ncbi:hypothetical protein [Trichocoleus sp. DQ-U1]|uniref:hypothetical protein n=1 Tax=Trichocoleus sp. DQ-U1 TaxID=2933926 RepID=UPI0032983873
MKILRRDGIFPCYSFTVSFDRSPYHSSFVFGVEGIQASIKDGLRDFCNGHRLLCFLQNLDRHKSALRYRITISKECELTSQRFAIASTTSKEGDRIHYIKECDRYLPFYTAQARSIP